MTPNPGPRIIDTSSPGPAPGVVPKPATPAAKAGYPVVKDTFREVVETVVFVAVLVLLLKTFVVEAFVIPTGSMAETLLGYQKYDTCPKCGLLFPVNASDEVDPSDGQFAKIVACTCPNCQFHDVWMNGDQVVRKPPQYNSGDRVLVAKGVLGWPRRWDVVVFKYPSEPQKNYTQQNYIKRLIGLERETVAICGGDLYVHRSLEYPEDAKDDMGRTKFPRPDEPRGDIDLWDKPYMYMNAEHAVEAFQRGEFEILRKRPAQLLAMRRLVYHNDHPAEDLIGYVPPRWRADAGSTAWETDNAKAPKVFRQTADAADTAWLRYQHLLTPRDTDAGLDPAQIKPQLIANVMGYNSGVARRFDGQPKRSGDDNQYWVGDLILECTADVSVAQGELLLELSRGPDRFRATFDLSSGLCKLTRQTADGDKELATAPTKLSRPGAYRLRLANVNHRLTVWVGDDLPFGDGVEYSAPASSGPHEENDLKMPANIGVRGTGRLSVRHLRLDRDSYYTYVLQSADQRTPPVTTLFVQPGHSLCLGDNSTQSSDGRAWGLVPDRLMLGRAVLVYFPFWPLGPVNRTGLIK